MYPIRESEATPSVADQHSDAAVAFHPTPDDWAVIESLMGPDVPPTEEELDELAAREEAREMEATRRYVVRYDAVPGAMLPVWWVMDRLAAEGTPAERIAWRYYRAEAVELANALEAKASNSPHRAA